MEELRNMKKSFLPGVKVLKNESLQNYDKDIPAEPSSERLLKSLKKKQILFLKEELRNKNELISSLIDQLSKNSDNIFIHDNITYPVKKKYKAHQQH